MMLPLTAGLCVLALAATLIPAILVALGTPELRRVPVSREDEWAAALDGDRSSRTLR